MEVEDVNNNKNKDKNQPVNIIDTSDKENIMFWGMMLIVCSSFIIFLLKN